MNVSSGDHFSAWDRDEKRFLEVLGPAFPLLCSVWQGGQRLQAVVPELLGPLAPV